MLSPLWKSPRYSDRFGSWIVGLLAVLAAVRALAELLPLLLRDDLYTGDACQHTWWMYRYRDASLFPHDLTAEYFSSPFLSPVGYRLVVGTAARVLDAQHVVEGLAILLAFVAIALAAVLGYCVGRRAGAAAALVVLWSSHSEQLALGGFPRSFGLVLLMAGMIALLRRRWVGFGGVVLASALLYPPMVLNLFFPAVMAATLAFVVPRRSPPASFYVCIILAVTAVGALAMTYLRPLPPWMGRPFVYQEIERMPEWHRLGRFRLLGYEPIHAYFDALNSGIGLTITQASVAAAALVLTVILMRMALPSEAFSLLVGSFLLWVTAHLLLFRLYFPDRYVMYALPVFAMLWAAGVAQEGCRYSLMKFQGLAFGTFTLIAIVLMAADVKAGYAIYGRPGDGTTAAGFGDALAFIRTLPKNTVIAAHPDDANAVPLRTRRSVLVNTEIALPIHSNYYAEMKRRTNDVFDLLYATDWNTVMRVAKRDRIGVFLLDTRRLCDPEQWPPYLPPFRRENERRIAAGRSAGFALLSPPDGTILFEAGDVMVVRLTKLPDLSSQRK